MSDYREQLKNICNDAAHSVKETSELMSKIITAVENKASQTGFFPSHHNHQLKPMSQACAAAGNELQTLRGQLETGQQLEATSGLGFGTASTAEV